MDLLSALHSFVRVAATGSFSTVSRETGVSQPTISRHIALLESHYGTTLFARTTRSLTMTEDGRSLLPHAYEVLEILETAETVLGRRRASVSGLVRLGVTTAFGLCLSRRLGELFDRHPDLSVEIVMRGRHKELDGGENKQGESGTTKMSTECAYYQLTIDGKEVSEIDIINMVLKVDGVDRLAEHRKAIGL